MQELLSEKNKNPEKIFQMKSFSKSEFEKHAPEFISENGDIDYEAVMEALFIKLKKITLLAKQNRYSLE